MPGAVGAELVVAQAPDGLEADGRVGADRALVVGRRVDGEAVVAALEVVGDGQPQRLAPEALPVPGVVRKMSSPTERYIGSVFSSQPSQPASAPSTTIAKRASGPRSSSRSGCSACGPHQRATAGSARMAMQAVEVVLGERSQEHALAAQRGEIHAAQCRRSVPSWPASQSRARLAPMTEHAPPRTERVDFRATSDPALQESADRGEANLLTYRELYELWERQQWAVQDLDFTQDRIDWHERIDPEERVARMYGLSSFFVGEQRVAAELGPIMRAVPDEDMRIFLCTQIADEARHVAFFDRFYREVGVLEADGLQARLEETSEHLNPEFHTLFDEMLRSRVDRLAVEPEDREALVEAITIYHMITEGMLALTGQHFIIDFNERAGTLPGFVAGFTNVARDEHRHVAFGARFLRDMAREDPRYAAAIQRALVEAGPVAEGVLRPKWIPAGRRRRRRALRRRLGGGDARLRPAGARSAG